MGSRITRIDTNDFSHKEHKGHRGGLRMAEDVGNEQLSEQARSLLIPASSCLPAVGIAARLHPLSLGEQARGWR